LKKGVFWSLVHVDQFGVGYVILPNQRITSFALLLQMKRVLNGVLQQISLAISVSEIVTIYLYHINAICERFTIWPIAIHVTLIQRMTYFCATFAALILMPCGGGKLEW
jgi:hypothetical protein